MSVDGGQWTVDVALRRKKRDDGSRADGPCPPSTVHRQLLLTAAITALAMLAPIAAHACPVCFGDPNSPMTKGTSNGVLFLLGIVGFVQLGFVALFFSFWRRARALKKFKEQFHVVR